ncbi:hypothetical protein DFH06DRAFT_137857 [Mycena polygramma]|nr:hypothetical protein DFH06DRAFT_137857 [Mycena polygramma]
MSTSVAQKKPDRCSIAILLMPFSSKYTEKEYDACHKCVHDRLPHLTIPRDPKDKENYRKVMAHMLPLVLMNARKIPHAEWRRCIKERFWIEQMREQFLRYSVTYALSWDTFVCGMATAKGSRVVEIGLGIRRHSCDAVPPVRMMELQLSETELQYVRAAESDDHMLSRSCCLLALKDAYIQAMGLPQDFARSRLDFSTNTGACLDGKPLLGWEFRMFQSTFGPELNYHFVCAFSNGTEEKPTIKAYKGDELRDWAQVGSHKSAVRLAIEMRR